MISTVRPLQPSDIPAAHVSAFAAFATLDAALGEPVPEHTDDLRRRGEARLEHLLGTDPDGAWVAERDGVVVGAAMALRRGSLWFLSLLVVAPDAQEQGLGQRLLEAALASYAGAEAGMIASSPDPRALRRYAAAGFTLQPTYRARGQVDRSGLSAVRGVRPGDLDADRELVDAVAVAQRRGPIGPDLAAYRDVGCSLLVADRADGRGYAIWRADTVHTVGATSPAVAADLLTAALAETDEQELTLDLVRAPWTVDVLLRARLSLLAGDTLCTRDGVGPLDAYLPHGAYG